MYGRDPPHLICYNCVVTTVSLVDKLLEDHDAILDNLRMNLLYTQQKMKLQADLKRRFEEFKEDDMEFLKLRPYRQH